MSAFDELVDAIVESDRYKAERDALRDALEEIANYEPYPSINETIVKMGEVARDALDRLRNPKPPAASD